jgi:hypothetical protein
MLLLGILFLTITSIGLAQTRPEEAGGHTIELSSLPFAWPQTLAQAARITKGQVLQLFQQIDAVVGGKTYSIGSYTFIKLDGDSLFLVATPDNSGRELYYFTVTIFCQINTCSVNAQESAPPHDLGREIVEDERGGHLLITKELVGQYKGTATKYIYTYRLHRQVGNKLIDASAEEGAVFEKKILPLMKKTAATALAMYSEDQEDKEETEAEIDFAYRDYERRILGSRDAGLEEALQWASSKNPKIQELAVNILEKIDAPEADTALSDLAGSSNIFIRDRAREVMEKKRESRLKSPR